MKYLIILSAVCFVFLLCDIYVHHQEKWNARKRKRRDILTELKKLDNNEDMWNLLTKKSSDRKESHESEIQDYDYETQNSDYENTWTDETPKEEPTLSSNGGVQQMTETAYTKITTSFITSLKNKITTETPSTEKNKILVMESTDTNIEFTSTDFTPSPTKIKDQLSFPTTKSNKIIPLFSQPETSLTTQSSISTTVMNNILTSTNLITSTTKFPKTETTTAQLPKTDTTTTQFPKTETTTQLPKKQTATIKPPKTETTTTQLPKTETTTTQLPTTETTITQVPKTETTTTLLLKTETTATQLPKTETTTIKLPKTETTSTQLPKTETSTTKFPKTETTTTQLPKTETTTAQLPKTDTTTTQFPKTETTTTQLPKMETTTTQLPKKQTTTIKPPKTETTTTKLPKTETTIIQLPKTETTPTKPTKTKTTTTKPPKTTTTRKPPKTKITTTKQLFSTIYKTTVTYPKIVTATTKPSKIETITTQIPKTETTVTKPFNARTTTAKQLSPTIYKTTLTYPKTETTKQLSNTITRPEQTTKQLPSTAITTTPTSLTTAKQINMSKPKVCDIFNCSPTKPKPKYYPNLPPISTVSTPSKSEDNLFLKEKLFIIPEDSHQFTNKPNNVTYKSVDNRNIDEPPKYVYVFGHFFPICFTFNHTKGIRGHDKCAYLSETSFQIIPISSVYPREKSIPKVTIPSQGFDPKKFFFIPQEKQKPLEVKQPPFQFERLYPTHTNYYTTMLPPVTRQNIDFVFSPERFHPIESISSTKDNQPSHIVLTAPHDHAQKHSSSSRPNGNHGPGHFTQFHLVMNERRLDSRPEERVDFEQLPPNKYIIIENPVLPFFKLPITLTEVTKEPKYHEKMKKEMTKISCLKCDSTEKKILTSKAVLEMPNVRNQVYKFSIDGKTLLPKNEFVPVQKPLHFYGKVFNHFQEQVSSKVSLHPVEDKIIHNPALGRWKRSIDEIDNAVSLVFVFDTTGSMSTELHLVKESAMKITSDLLNKSDIKIHDFIFVPFNDFNNRPQPTQTRDSNVFINAINSVYIGGGVDCPEQSLAAILEAIKLSRPNSYIYVFTDALGKDYDKLVPQIIALTQRKHPQIFFLLTGYCLDKVYPGDQRMAYSTIAAVSSGLVIDLNRKSDIKKVFNYITENSKQGKVLLKSVSFKKGIKLPYIITLNVDPTIKEMTVSTTGVDVSLYVLNPDGSKPNSSEIQNLLNLDNINVFCVQQPKPGLWKIYITRARSAHSVVTTALSSNTFTYGFSIIPTNELKETSINPMKGAQNYLLIKTTSPELTDRVLSVTLVNLDGVVLGKYNTSYVHNGTYIIGPFVPPDRLFKLEIHGETNDGFPLERISTTAISPQMPEKPFISGKTNITARIGEPIDISCHIQSLVPVTVKMFKRPSTQIISKSFSQSSEISHHIPYVSKSDEGIYLCWSQNIAGVTILTINLVVTESPPVVVLDQKSVVAHMGETLDIQCRVHSRTPHRLSWKKIFSNNTSYQESIMETDQPSASIQFDQLTVQDSGVYICSATNGGGEDSVQVAVEVIERPEVEVSNNVFYFKINSPILLECKITKGIPMPTIKWFKSYFLLNASKEINIQHAENSIQLKIENAKKSDQGVYICLASNSAGTYHKEINVYLGEEPVVSIHYYKNIVYSLSGQDLQIQCNASGVPKPHVVWKKKTNNGISDVNHSNGVLNFKSPTLEDSGRYICIATNMIGRGEDSIFVTFGTNPKIETASTDANLEIDGTASLSCTTSGIPEPRITWRRKDGKAVQAQSIENILDFRKVTLAHQGIYICKAENYFGMDEKEVNVSIIGTTPPKLIQNGSDQIVKHLIGERVELQCVIKEGNPQPKIRWEQYGGDTDALGLYGFVAKNGSLIFNALSIRLIGNYSCIAENGVGVDMKNVTLQQFEPPIIYERTISSVTANVGNPVILHCETTGDPKPTVKWTRDSYQFNSIMRGYRKENSTSLYFDAVQVEDSGRYLCLAKNLAGEMTKEVTLQVFVPPKILSWKKEVSVELGNAISLRCNAVGIPKPDVKWLKDNIPLKKYYGGEVWFTPETSDAGVYTCLAENKVGIDKADIMLEILEKPVINNLPNEIEVIKGKQAVLICKATGYPLPKVHWEFNENILNGKNEGNGTVVLNISKASDTDEGIYLCVASNKVNTIMKKVQLLVLEPPLITPWVDIAKAAPGEEVVLECNAVAKPKSEISWFLNGEPFNEGYLSSDGTLRFQVRKNHSGDFNCVAINKAGSDSKKITLLILEPPKFAPNLPSTVQTLSGSNLDLLCLAFGEPEPIVHWERNNSLSPNYKTSFSSIKDILTIYNITVDDEGMYTCRAENKAGISSYTVKLIVFEIPKTMLTINSAHNSAVYENQEIILRCEIRGKPAPKVTWHKDGKLIAKKYTFNSTVLRFTATEQDSGNFTCIASNSVGSDNSTIQIIVKVEPKFENPENEELAFVENSDAVLMCKVKGSPLPKLIWSQNGMLIKNHFILEGNGTSKLYLQNVTYKNSGKYSCMAVNVLGTKEKFYHVDIQSLPSIVDEILPSEVNVNFGEDFALPCTVKGQPKPDVKWKIGGEFVPSNIITEVYMTLEDNTLVLMNVSEKTSGEYVCTATNNQGIVKKVYKVTVSAPIPSIPEDFELVEELDGNPAKLHCLAKPGEEIIWFKNGVNIKEKRIRSDVDQYEVKDNGMRLNFDEVYSSTGGNYTCIIKRNGKSITKNFFLNVLHTPYFLDEFYESEFKVEEGNGVKINCDIGGNPLPKVTWRFKKHDSLSQIPITNLTLPNVEMSEGILKIIEAQLSHNGIYMCQGSNKVGSVKRSFNLKVSRGQKRVVNKSEVKYFIENEPFELHCDIKGDSNSSYKWEFQSSINSIWNSNLTDNMNILRRKRANKFHHGLFYCRGENAKEKIEKSFQVNVIVSPSIAANGTSEFTVMESRPFELHCIVFYLTEVKVVWNTRQNTILTNNSTNLSITEIGNKHILRVFNSSKTDEGVYTCLAKNRAGTDKQSFKVKIIAPLKYLKDISTKLYQTEGLPLKIKCPIWSDVKSEILWEKDNVLIDKINAYLNQSDYIIEKTNISNNGSYKCKVFNPGSNLEATVNVFILASSNLVSQNINVVKFVSGSSFTLKCMVPGNIKQNITWFKGNSLLTNSKENLHFVNVKEEDGGIYYCANNSGLINTFSLIVKVKLHWSEWSQWSSCSKSCDEGEQIRTRVIVGRKSGPLENYFIEYDNSTITGPSVEKQQCNYLPCTPNGIWSDWLDWSLCSSSCGKGTRYRSRICQGFDCIGEGNESESCSLNPCPIKGGWSDWSEWNHCSVTCGNGVKMRVRSCTNPKPEFDGENCSGNGREIVQCSIEKCSLGEWSPWSVWSPCNVSCGRGIQIRTRVCLLENRDLTCQGNKTQIIRCKKQSCHKNQKN
ncbi:hemicentin-1-like isoform X2 [Cimex lectularius]|uniref:Ig-like domain-containing protein n=1 Tax=Cimex lectularius TaxID=79782 RepID=A0A8I6S095_CIMLE|nr:hemicentin-1-like isoform X2 [Cimex lectularius]